MTAKELPAPGTRAAQYQPGDTFEGLGMRSTLSELSDEVFRTEVEASADASGGPLHRHLHQASASWSRRGSSRSAPGFAPGT